MRVLFIVLGILVLAVLVFVSMRVTDVGDGTATPILDSVAADPGHYSVLFENDVARVLRVKYPPGSKSVMHSHPALCAIFVTSGTFKMTPGEQPKGVARIVAWMVGSNDAQDHPAGEVSCADAEVHLPENPGSTETELILIELQDRKTFDNIETGKSISFSSAPNVPDAITADSAHYKVEAESDDIRLLRIKLGAGEKTAMHAHPAYCAIELSDSTTKEGSGQPTESKTGEVSCGDALTHAPENVGKTLAESVVIEFKNRKTFKP